MDTFIYTQKNEKIAVNILESVQENAPVVILEHGLAGFKEEGMMIAAQKAFENFNFTVVSFDARFGLGDSDGDLKEANFTHFIEDLDTVVAWVKTQEFYKGKLFLCGHSLGAGACFDYAIHQPQDVSGLVSMAAVVSGKLLLQSYLAHKPEFVQNWEKTKFVYREHPLYPHKNGYISYAHLQDAMRYHLVNDASKIKCPVLMICADRDISSTLDINRQFFDALSVPKEFVVVPNSSHTFKAKENQELLSQSIEKWLKNILNL